MEMPSYDGIMEAWKVKLIIGRAKKYGLKSHEIPDVLQECVLTILDAKHDENHASGATERTLLVAIVDKIIQKMKRTDQRYQIHVERFGQTASEFSREEVDMQTLEIADIIERLTPQEKAICHGLAGGMSKAEVAQKIGCDWHTVDHAIHRLRQHFAEFNFDKAVMPDANNRSSEDRKIQ